MSTEIDELHYCSNPNVHDVEHCKDKEDMSYYGALLECRKCNSFMHKWENPAQYEQRTGHALRDDAPVWYWSVIWKKWLPQLYKGVVGKAKNIVIATTEWGKPPEGWKPEEDKNVTVR
jgi:hypothetical protein